MTGAVRWALNLLYPPRCILCRGLLTEKQGFLCESCQKNAPEYPYGASNPEKYGKTSGQFLDSFTAVWYYEEDVRRSLLRYKFHRASHLAPKYASALAAKVRQQGMAEPDVLTWVPVSRRRRFQRGYDQCELLAKALGRELGIRAQRALRKHRHTPPQSGIHSLEARRANVLGAFQIPGNVNLRGKRVLLVDDIRTTGATMNECARVLLTAGAKEVHGAAVAAVRNQKK